MVSTILEFVQSDSHILKGWHKEGVIGTPYVYKYPLDFDILDACCYDHDIICVFNAFQILSVL